MAQLKQKPNQSKFTILLWTVENDDSTLSNTKEIMTIKSSSRFEQQLPKANVNQQRGEWKKVSMYKLCLKETEIQNLGDDS